MIHADEQEAFKVTGCWIHAKRSFADFIKSIGHKNFVLMESNNGAKTSAMICSIVETTKANELNTYKYLELFLTEIQKHIEDNSLQFIDSLLPWSPRYKRNTRANIII